MINQEGFSEFVANGWKNGRYSNQRTVADRLRLCRSKISWWKRNNRTNAREKITILRNQLDRGIASRQLTTENKNRMQDELNKAYREEEKFWKLKSRNKWLKEGDYNSSFFHNSTLQKRKKQHIRALRNEQGQIRYGTSKISEIAISYFQNQYTSTIIDPLELNAVFQNFQPRVTESINDSLIGPVTEEEICFAAFSIGPSRAPGPDGFTRAFYQNHWPDIKDEINQEISDFFNNDRLDCLDNHTNICLIPKITGASEMAEFDQSRSAMSAIKSSLRY